MTDILYEMHDNGTFDTIDVVLTKDKLEYHSYWEGKAEGYHFEMVRDAKRDVFVVTMDETSHPVPGSDILFAFHYKGITNWDQWYGPIIAEIPADQILDAVKRMAEDDASNLELFSNTDFEAKYPESEGYIS